MLSVVIAESGSANLTILGALLAAAAAGGGFWLFRAKKGKRVAVPEGAEAWLAGVYGVWTGTADSASWDQAEAQTWLENFYGVSSSKELAGVISGFLKNSKSRSCAWDLGRAADLLRIGIAAGFFSRSSAAQRIPAIAECLLARYSSWEEYAAAFESGMRRWQRGQNITDEDQVERVQSNLAQLRYKVWSKAAWRLGSGDAPEPISAESPYSGDGDVEQTSRGAAVVRKDGRRRWVSTWNRNVPASAWQDEWGPVPSKDLATLFLHTHRFEAADDDGDTDRAEEIIKGFGYEHVGHYFQVYYTFIKHFPADASVEMLRDLDFDETAVGQAAMEAVELGRELDFAKLLESQPDLLEPVHGQSLESYAELQAHLATISGQDAVNTFLASHGLNMATLGEVTSTWTARMQKDTSTVLATRYSAHFSKAAASTSATPAGNPAAAADAATAGGAAATAGADAAVPDGAPLSLEKYSEVAGAMTAWGEAEQDMMAMLEQCFQMSGVDYSNAATFWSERMAKDPAVYSQHDELRQRFAEKYRAGAAAG